MARVKLLYGRGYDSNPGGRWSAARAEGGRVEQESAQKALAVLLDSAGGDALTGAVEQVGTRAGDGVRIDVVAPTWFSARTKVAIHACGLAVVLPVLAAALVMSLGRFAPWKALLPLGAVAVTAFIMPVGQGNPWVGRMVRGLNPKAGRDPGEFIVQLTLTPRLQTGLWAEIEDADDIGWLRLTETELVFEGDSVKIGLPYGQIERVESRNMGWRGLYVYGRRVVVEFSGSRKFRAAEFAERASWVLPQSRRMSRLLWERLSAKVRR